jgi:hypothetical protein
MLQVKIRTLMIWVLFVAVFLALMTPAIRSTGPDRGSIWVVTVLGVPFGMAGLSAVVEPDRPAREDAGTCNE